MNPNQPFFNTNNIPGELDVSMESSKEAMDVSMNTDSIDVSMKTDSIDVSMAPGKNTIAGKPYIPPWVNNAKKRQHGLHSPRVQRRHGSPNATANAVPDLVSVPPAHQGPVPPQLNALRPPPQVSPEIIIVPEAKDSSSADELPAKRQRLQDNTAVAVPTAQKRKIDNDNDNDDNDNSDLQNAPAKRRAGNEREPVAQPDEVRWPRPQQVFQPPTPQRAPQAEPKGKDGPTLEISQSTEPVVPPSEFRQSVSQVLPGSLQMSESQVLPGSLQMSESQLFPTSMGESQTPQFTIPQPPPPLSQQQQQQQHLQQRNYFELSNSNMKRLQKYNNTFNSILYYVLVICYVAFVMWLIFVH